MSLTPASPPSWPPPSQLTCRGQRNDACTTLWVSTILATCVAETDQTCELAARESAIDPNYVGGGLPWGMMVSLVGDVIISVGLALQKVAHNRIKAQAEEIKARGEEPPKANYAKEKIWWIGIVLTIGGEVGNFVAYGE